MSKNNSQDIRRKSIYEPLRRNLHSRPPISRSATLPPTDSQQQHQHQQQKLEAQDSKDQSLFPPMGSNMRVYVRCRSRNQREIDEKSSVVISTLGAKGKEVVLSNGPNTLSQYKKTYAFDQVFGAESDQETVFNSVARSYIHEMLQGYNCTVFAYGQTGTGKTYTMSGDIIILGDLESKDKILLGEHAGIIPRVLVDLFKQLAEESNEHSVKISFLELYNERLKDLLADGDELEEKIRIFDNNTGTHYGKQNTFNTNSHNHNTNANNNSNSSSSIMVKGMEEIYIKSANEGLKLLMTGSLKRKVAATKCNDLSSRSHTVFTITTNVSKTDPVSGEQYIKIGKLNLVDLAGSENINRSGAENKRAQEAGLINKSLLTLGRVINALVDHSQHIPYRESKLTRLLQDSLGGKTKTCIIATISPAKISTDETVSTLEYATRARSIKNTPQINQSMSKNSCIMEYIQEIDRLRQELKASRQKEGMYITQDQYDLYESNGILVEEQKVRIKNMEEQIKKFKEKYVEQTDLNKKTEQRLKESEIIRNNVQEQKRDILQVFDHYQKHCNQYVEKVAEIHRRNLALINALQLERKNIHESSVDANKMIFQILAVIKMKANEFSCLNTDLDSYTVAFKKNSKCLLTDTDTIVSDRTRHIKKELSAVDLHKYVAEIQDTHSALGTALDKFGAIPWDQETDVIYANHREVINDCYQKVNTYNASIQRSITELLKRVQCNSKSNINDIRQVGLGHLNDLFKVIIDQRKNMDQLEQELRGNKIALKKSTNLVVQMQKYFKDRVRAERSDIFRTIMKSVEDAEKRHMSLDDELLNTTLATVEKSKNDILEEQLIDIKRMGQQRSTSLDFLKSQLEHFVVDMQTISEKQIGSLDGHFPYHVISSSFQNLSDIVSKLFCEESSKPLLESTKKLGHKISSKCASLESEINMIVETAQNHVISRSDKNQRHVHSAMNEVAVLSEAISKKCKDQFGELLDEQGDVISKFLDGTNSVINTLKSAEEFDSMPIRRDLKVDVEKEIVVELPKMSSPRDYKIYEDKEEKLKIEPHSPLGGPLLFCPSTPVPVPDQPLPRVLAPRSINSNTKRLSTLSVEPMKSNLAHVSSNDLKRRFTADAVLEIDDDSRDETKQVKKFHLRKSD